MAENVVLLHGFGGTRRAWDAVTARIDAERYLATALDLPGHGKAARSSGAVTVAGCVRHVLAAAPERFALCGYSLGGRIALHVALAAPERVSRLVLVSTGGGIEDAAARAVRRRADLELARRLEREPFEDFIEQWNAQELFAGDPARVRALASEDLRRNRPRALAGVLRGIGTGAMEPLWPRLAELEMPVLLLVGERDRRYVLTGRRLAAALAGPSAVAVLPGGHRLALECPRELALQIATDPPVSRGRRGR